MDSLAYVSDPAKSTPDGARRSDAEDPSAVLRPPGARTTPPPLEANTPRLVLAGIALWLVALVVGLIAGRDDQDWVWTCIAGVGLGLLGLPLARASRRRQLRRPPTLEDPG